MTSFLVAVTLALAPAFAAQHDGHGQHKAAMDHRGHQAMGFDQRKIRHTFTPTDRGGTIDIAALDARDAPTIAKIRTHLAEVAKLFKAGDFSKPVFIHAQDPPGADTMKSLRGDIDYRFEEKPAGGSLAVTSANREAVAAIHAFLRFQDTEHK